MKDFQQNRINSLKRNIESSKEYIAERRAESADYEQNPGAHNARLNQYKITLRESIQELEQMEDELSELLESSVQPCFPCNLLIGFSGSKSDFVSHFTNSSKSIL